MAAPLFEHQRNGDGWRYWSRVPIPLGTVLVQERPMATLPKDPTQAEVLQAIGRANIHSFGELPISPHFRHAMPAIDPVIARYKSNRLRQGIMIIGGNDVEAFGIFPLVASFPPSCTPNLHPQWTGSQMELRAAFDIPANTILSVSREIDWILAPRHARHSRLLDRFGIDCPCQVGAGTLQEIDKSDRTRASISPVVNKPMDPQRGSEEQQIKEALDQLRNEGLYMYRDTLLYDLYLLYRRTNNNAMLLEARRCLVEAHLLASAYVGENELRVRSMASAIATLPK